MPYSEYLSWAAYIRKRGTLNPGLRNEWLMARVSYQVSKACGGKVDFEDFLRYQDEKVATMEDIARMIGIKPAKEN